MKGSASIEILIILIVLIYMAAIVYKGVVVSGFQFIEDEHKIAMGWLAAEKIANTVQFLKESAPGTTKKVKIMVPENVELKCVKDSKHITVTINTKKRYDACYKTKTCKKHVEIKLSCKTDWKIKGPKNTTVAMVKIGEHKVKIGEPA